MQDERRGFGETSPRRPHTNGNGFRSESARALPVPFGQVPDEPIDLVAVQADDELIGALAAGMTVSAPGVGGYDADDQVAAMLAAWRAEVDAEPLPDMLDLDTATATVLAASRPPGRRARHLVPLAAAAAMIVFTIGGVSIGASEARPGDALWDVSRVLYSERAESVEAVERVEARIDEAKSALARGESVVAAQILNGTEDELVVIRAEEGLAELAELKSFLEAKAAETPPGQPIQPGTPLASDPTRPVPLRAGTTDPIPADPAPPAADTVEPSEDAAVEAEISPPSEVEPSASDEPSADPSSTPESPATEGDLTPSETEVPPTAEGGEDTDTDPSLGTSAPTGGSGTPTAAGTTTSGSTPAS